MLFEEGAKEILVAGSGLLYDLRPHLIDDYYQTIVNGKPFPVTEEHIMQQLEILEG